MDPRESEYYEFLDLSDIEETERDRLKETLFSESTSEFLELPWISSFDTKVEAWKKEIDVNEDLANGPIEGNPSSSPPMVVQNRVVPQVAAHIPAVTMYSQPPPAYTMPPPSSGYQHPQNVFLSNVTANMHGYMHTQYVQPYASIPEPPPEIAGRGHRGRSRGRGKRNDMRMENTMVESSSPSFNQHQPFLPIHAYHPAYYTQAVGSPMQHPTAQHATGSPLYIAPMYHHPMYGAYHHHGAQYYPPPNAHVNAIMEDHPQDLPEIIDMNLEQHQQQMYQQQQPVINDESNYEIPADSTQTVIVNNMNSCVVKTVDVNENNAFVVNNVCVGNNNNVITEVHGVEPKLAEHNSVVVPENIVKTEPDPIVTNKTVENAENTNKKPNVEVIETYSKELTSAVVNFPKTQIAHKSVKTDSPPVVNNTNPQPQKKQEITVNSELKQEQQKTPTINKTEVPIPVAEPKQKPQPEAPVVTALPNTGKSWASLFSNNKSSSTAVNNNQQNINANNDISKSSSNSKPSYNSMFPKANEQKTEKFTGDSASIQRGFLRIGEFLSKYNLDYRTVSLQPRGLTNRSNYCYINSILQALLACPPFYNLLVQLPHQRNRRKNNGKTTTPILDSMVDFVNEFTPLSAEARLNRKEKGQRKDVDIICGTSFEPTQIYKILNGIRSDSFVVEGRQEDAEEYFGCLLNGLNDEMLELSKKFEEQNHPNLSNGDIASTNGEAHDQDDEWMQVMGPKNKGSITRRTDFGRTPVSDIFRGQLRCRVHRIGDQVTDNVQPFFTLQLDIEKPNNVLEALEQLVNKDKIEGVTCRKTNEQVEAWQQVTIDELPVVLVLHLKCFNYKLDACSKIIKALTFPIDLRIDSKLLSSKSKYSAKQKQYKLFAVVYHDGKEASKGHYLTDAYHVGYGGWVRYDDSAVKYVQEQHVLHPTAARVPYLLFYRRCDTIGIQQQNAKKDQ